MAGPAAWFVNSNEVGIAVDDVELTLFGYHRSVVSLEQTGDMDDCAPRRVKGFWAGYTVNRNIASAKGLSDERAGRGGKVGENDFIETSDDGVGGFDSEGDVLDHGDAASWLGS